MLRKFNLIIQITLLYFKDFKSPLQYCLSPLFSYTVDPLYAELRRNNYFEVQRIL